MNLTEILNSRLESLPDGEDTQGLKAVLQHITVANDHLSLEEPLPQQHTRTLYTEPTKRLREVLRRLTASLILGHFFGLSLIASTATRLVSSTALS
jgi:hypothetical protein